MKKEKSDYYCKKLTECQNNVREVWKTSYQLLGQSKNLSPKQILYNNGCVVSSPRLMAEAFNEIFIDKVQKVKAKS